jgi:glycosyltransferase involved in cell wall biosynthesis
MILHITNDYANSTVYKNLISNLDENGIEQIVYTPVKKEKSIGGNLIELKEKNSEIIYSNILNMHIDRILFNVKINKINKDIHTKVDFKKITCIHAHTWFSDGAVALKLYREYNIPYMIAVRSSDLNQFWKLPHLKAQGLEILRHAKKIILITPRYQERFLDIDKIKKLGEDIAKKTVVIPNGLDPYWIANTKPRKTTLNSPVNMLYIGVFDKRKNVALLLESIKNVINLGIKCKVTLIGGGGNYEKEILKIVSNNPNFEFIGKIYDKGELKSIFEKTDIFAMISLKETFGLVYAEALSQGIPVLYSQNEGIDGVFENNVGIAVNPRSIKSITEGIKNMIDDYQQFDFEPNEIAVKLDWKKIVLDYIDLYKEIQSKRNN